jgi:ABC-type nitrate/sulfonate/bicarbonate transport system substrate-binding protein
MITAELFAEEEGLEVDLQDFASGADVLTGVTTGSLDIGAAGLGAALYNAQDEGLPFTLVAPQHNGYVEDYFMLSSTVADDQEEATELGGDLSPLAGETFTVNAPGVVTDYVLGLALENGGLSYDDVEVETMPFPDMVPALDSGAVAGGVVSEPFPTIAEGDGSALRPFESPDEEPMAFTAVTYNSTWAESEPEAAEAFMRAYAKTAEHLDEVGWEDDEVLDIINSVTDIEPDTLRDNRPHHLPVDLHVDLDAMRDYQEFYAEIGELQYDELLDDTEMWDLSFRDAVIE